MKLQRGVWFVPLCLLLAVVPVFAQVNGAITGTVLDHTGAVVAGADVTVSYADKGIHRTTKTNSSGDYLVAGLGAGTYDVTVTAPGFEKYQAKSVVLRVGEKIRVDTTLVVGKVSSTVQVEGNTAGQVETQSSEVAGTITGKQISQLELNGRNFTQLINLVPGVSNQTGQDEGTVGVAGEFLYAINGGRTEYNNLEVDGGDNMDNGSNGSLNVYPSIDALAEVRVLTSTYGAQYGRNGSATIEAVTKSGTNEFHGEAFEFLRNEAFNAHNYFDPPDTDKPSYKKHDFGYIFGGPIIKNKTFFFWSQEFRREDVPFAVYSQDVPSAAERGGDFTDACPAPGTAFYRSSTNAPSNWTNGFYPDCPAYQLDPTLTYGPYLGYDGFNNNNLNGTINGGQSQIDTANSGPLVGLIPQPNEPPNLFQESWPQITHWHEELFKIDQNFTPKIHGSFRFIHDTWQQWYPISPWSGSSVPAIGGTIVGPGVSLVANLTATASPTLLNEFVASYTTDHLSLLQGSNAWQRPSSMTMTGIFNNGFGGSLPKFVINNGQEYSNSGGGQGFTIDTSSAPWFNSNPTYTYKDNVTKIIGKHNLQFGGYFVAAQKNEDASVEPQGWLVFTGQGDQSYSGTVGYNSTGNAFADLLLGQINQFGQASQKIKYYFRYKIFEPYVQDDWHATKRLTLNLGVRLSLYGTYRERYGQAYNFDPASYNSANAPTISPVDGSLVFPPGQSINTLSGMVNCGANGVPVGCMSGHLFNPAPRLGFAFDPKGDGKTSLRGGYGIFFEHMNGDEANDESLEGQPPLVVNSYQSNISGTPNGPSGYLNIGGAAGSGAEYFPIQVYSIPGPQKAIWPYVQQWHLDIQHEVARGTLLTVAYVGSKGTHLSLMRDINQLPSVPAAQNPYALGQPITAADCNNLANGTNNLGNGTPVTGQAINNLNVACGNISPDSVRVNYPGYDQIQRIDLFANSNYNALQVSGRRAIGGLEFTLAYTYSHSIDDSSDRYDSSFVDSYNIPASRASSTFDQRQILTVSYVYDLPLFRHSTGKTKTFLGGWQLSGITAFQTGEPFPIINGAYYDNAGVANGAGTGSYADIVGNPHASIPAGEKYAPGVTGPLLFNPAAYDQPQGLTFGDSGRDSLNMPRRTNFDMGLFKHFALGESKAFEFRAEGFNVFNHPQWNGVNNYSCGVTLNSGSSECVEGSTAANVPASTFLHPSGAHNPRIGQFGMKFIF